MIVFCAQCPWKRLDLRSAPSDAPKYRQDITDKPQKETIPRNQIYRIRLTKCRSWQWKIMAFQSYRSIA